MNARIVALATTCLVAFGCPMQTKPPPAGPAIKSFTASASRIVSGQSVTLTFATERAKSATLVDQTGQELSVMFDEATQSGTATAMPRQSGFFVLRVTGDGGGDAAFVQVAVDEDLKTVFLVAVPNEVKPGERVDLVWSAFGGKNVKLMEGSTELSSMTSGTLTITRTKSTSFTLTASALAGMRMATASLTVQPVISSFTVDPGVARPGATMNLAWKTLGADNVRLREETYGELYAGAADPDGGAFAFTVPATDAGMPTPTDGGTDAGVVDAGVPNQPLRFILEATTVTPAQMTSAAVNARIGTGPTITSFTAPPAITAMKAFSVSWVTANAVRIELWVNGQPVLRPNAGASLSGSYAVSAITANTRFTLRAYDGSGFFTERTLTTALVAAPAITAFTMPMTIGSPATPAMATWTTTNATRLVLRVKDGPNVFLSDVAATVAMGSAPVLVPALSTFVLEAYNAAGDRVTAQRTVDVTAPVAITVTPNPTVAPSVVELTWNVSALSPSALLGLAPLSSDMITPVSASTNWNELTTSPLARTLTFSSVNDAVAEVSLPDSFVFPYLGRLVSKVWVSTNGFVALASATSLATNADLTSTTATTPPLLAPFWDDLTLGTDGSVLWSIEGATFPRKLTIQWQKAAVSGQTGSELTFQVQVFETGQFSFLYKDLKGPRADGSFASIGFTGGQNVGGRAFRYNTTTVGVFTEGDELEWFKADNARATGALTPRITATTPLGFYAQTSAGFVPVFAVARAFAPGAIIVNEVMPIPASGVSSGKWVELLNPGSDPVEIGGLTLSSLSDPMTTFAFPSPTTIMPRSYLVSGQSTDMALNGGAPVTLSWGAIDLPMQDRDGVELRVPGTQPDGGALVPISRLVWGAATTDGGMPGAPAAAGVSNQSPDRTLPPSTCTRTMMFGGSGQTGTPGGANESCFDYALTAIPVEFEDISGTPALTRTGGTADDGYINLTLPAPFTYFGAQKTAATMCTNGWVVLETTSQTDYSNLSTPSATADPKGLLAVFWDDLTTSGSTATMHMARVGNKTIFQWTEVSTLSESASRLTFQVKLFDTGVVEYHYGTMSAPDADRARGSSATVWLEKSDGTVALPVSVNTTGLASDSAWRFTPRN